MVHNFRKSGAAIAVATFVVIGLCGIAGLGLGQVPEIEPAAKPKPKPKTKPSAHPTAPAAAPATPATPAATPVVPDTLTAPSKPAPSALTAPSTLPTDLGAPTPAPKAKVAPGTLATATEPSGAPDSDMTISPAGEPIVVRVQNVVAPVTV